MCVYDRQILRLPHAKPQEQLIQYRSPKQNVPLLFIMLDSSSILHYLVSNALLYISQSVPYKRHTSLDRGIQVSRDDGTHSSVLQ